MGISKFFLFLIVFATLEGCSAFSSKPKPVNLNGSFKISMSSTAQYFDQVPEYPVSATLLNAIPYFNQTLPAGSGLIGIYKNHGLRCKIVWTAIIPPNGSTLSNPNGVAISSCFPRETLKESDIIEASWN